MTFGHFQLNFCLLLPLLPQSNYMFLALIITKQFPPTLFILYKIKHARLLVTSPIKICYNHKLPFFYLLAYYYILRKYTSTIHGLGLLATLVSATRAFMFPQKDQRLKLSSLNFTLSIVKCKFS